MSNVQEWLEKPTNKQRLSYHVESHLLGRAVFLSELVTLHIDDLRNLYNEITAEKESMARSVQSFTERIKRESIVDSDSPIIRKFEQLKRKFGIYSTFSRLIKREVNWRLAINTVSRLDLIIKAKAAGVSDSHISTLLHPFGRDIDSDSVECQSDNSHALQEAYSYRHDVEALRNSVFNAEFCKLLAAEFDSEELSAIKAEAWDKVNSFVNWNKLTECQHVRG